MAVVRDTQRQAFDTAKGDAARCICAGRASEILEQQVDSVGRMGALDRNREIEMFQSESDMLAWCEVAMSLVEGWEVELKGNHDEQPQPWMWHC